MKFELSHIRGHQDLQFLSNKTDILQKLQAHEYVILVEYQLDGMSNVFFFLTAHFQLGGHSIFT